MDAKERDRLASGLGASRAVETHTSSIGGPLDMVQLRDEFSARLRSTGGRPTDPSWSLTRLVPFKEENWSRLQGIASEVGRSGRRVGAAQVAAILIENSLDEIDDARWEDALSRTREAALLSEPAAAEAARFTYNQFDDWVQRGWIVPASRRGRQRLFSADEVVRAQWLKAVASTSGDLEGLAPDVRACDLTERYLVVVNGEHVHTARTRAQLYRILESPGTHLVIDQLPERRKLLGLPPLPSSDYEDDVGFSRAV